LLRRQQPVKTVSVRHEDAPAEPRRWHHGAFVVGFVLPLLLSAAYTYVVADAALAEGGVPAGYPVALGLALGLPPMLLGGIVLSWLLRRPRDLRGRALLGLLLGGVLFFGGQHDWFVF
jgi:hypothetical protein